MALAYAEQFPSRVTELALFGVTTGCRQEFEWHFRDGLGLFFPKEWEQRRNAVPIADRDTDIVEAFCRLLRDSYPKIRERAAIAWYIWESATPDWPPTSDLAVRFHDASFAMAFARIVTHYVNHNGWLGDGRVLRDVHRLEGIAGVLVSGRLDFQAPLATAWKLHSVWPRSELIIVDNAGHVAGPSITRVDSSH